MFPKTITAGDTVTFTYLSRLYLPPDDYTLSWAIRGAVALNVTAVEDSGGSYLTTITAAQTATLTPGEYTWQAYLTNSDNERQTIGQGRVTVKPNLFTQTAPYSTITSAEQMLVEVEAAIGAVTEGQAYKIKDREMTRANLSELVTLRDRLRWEIFNEKRQQDIANGLPDPRKVRVRFR
jgi:hypothetical protein